MGFVIRKAGKWTFWTVEFWGLTGTSKMEDWHQVGSGSQFVDNIPNWLRRHGDRNAPDLEPFREFSACGEVWQKTGNNGLIYKKDALALAGMLAQYNPDHIFRAVEVKLELAYGADVRFRPAPEE